MTSFNSTGGRVRVMPLGIDLEVKADESIMAAAQRLGYYWPTICRGDGVCSRCHLVVEAGWEELVPPDKAEQETLQEIEVFAGPRTRLACQALVNGGDVVVVTKPGVRHL